MGHTRTATQYGIDVVLVAAIITLLIGLFIPAARETNILSIAPLIAGAITAIIVGISRKLSSTEISP